MGRGTVADDQTVESDLDGEIAARERRLSRKRVLRPPHLAALATTMGDALWIGEDA